VTLRRVDLKIKREELQIKDVAKILKVNERTLPKYLKNNPERPDLKLILRMVEWLEK